MGRVQSQSWIRPNQRELYLNKKHIDTVGHIVNLLYVNTLCAYMLTKLLMAKITFITSDKETITVEGTSGSVMELAVEHNIKGIDGDCGGVCSCATCHVHVLPEHTDKTGEADEMESDMLEFDDLTDEYSRLSCQLAISDALDGLVVRVAK